MEAIVERNVRRQLTIFLIILWSCHENSVKNVVLHEIKIKSTNE